MPAGLLLSLTAEDWSKWEAQNEKHANRKKFPDCSPGMSTVFSECHLLYRFRASFQSTMSVFPGRVRHRDGCRVPWTWLLSSDLALLGNNLLSPYVPIVSFSVTGTRDFFAFILSKTCPECLYVTATLVIKKKSHFSGSQRGPGS